MAARRSTRLAARRGQASSQPASDALMVIEEELEHENMEGDEDDDSNNADDDDDDNNDDNDDDDDDDDNNDDDDEADKEDDNEADEVDEARDDTTETTTEAVAPVRSSAPKKARWSQSPKVSRRSLYQRYGHSLTLVSLQCRWRDWPTTRSKCASGDAPRVVGPVLAHAFRVKFIGSTMSWSRVPRTPSPYESLSACRW